MATKRSVSLRKEGEYQKAPSVAREADHDKKVASWCAINPSVVVSTITAKYGKQQFENVDFGQLIKETDQHLSAIADGDMSGIEAMLYGQAVALQSIFMNLVHRAHAQTYLPITQTYLTLAFKAQGQSRLALEALAEVKNPRQPTFVKQQNIAHQQQVNNGVPLAQAREEIVETSNKLIKEESHAQLDAGRAAKAIGTHPKVETMEVLNRANNSRRKEARKS